MNIHFNYQGSNYNAGLSKQDDDKIIVLFNDKELEQQFGPSLPFVIKDKKVEFNMTNLCHSNLFALNSSLSKAIKEQFVELS